MATASPRSWKRKISSQAVPATAYPGDRDLQAYWSSAYLFARGEDFSDPIRLGEIEHTLTTREEADTLHSWFSPIGNVVLLPFTLLPFSKAASYWLAINILILFGSALLLWSDTDRKWIPLIATFSFAMTVYSLVFGQINCMEVLGLALFLALNRAGKPYPAGAILVLTTIKPHLGILTLPILLLDLLQKREWKVLAGFAAALLLCMLILFAFSPFWIQSFTGVVSSGMSNVRETPTLPGLLVILGQYTIGKGIPMASALGMMRRMSRPKMYSIAMKYVSTSLGHGPAQARVCIHASSPSAVQSPRRAAWTRW